MLRFIIESDDVDGLDAADREDLARYLTAQFAAVDDESAWRPMVRARRLVEHSKTIRGRR